MSKLNIVHELSGVATSTLENWFHGTTISPQNRTIGAVMSSLGYKRTWQKERDIDFQKELKIAKAWNARQQKIREQAEKRISRSKSSSGPHRETRPS